MPLKHNTGASFILYNSFSVYLIKPIIYCDYVFLINGGWRRDDLCCHVVVQIMSNMNNYIFYILKVKAGFEYLETYLKNTQFVVHPKFKSKVILRIFIFTIVTFSWYISRMSVANIFINVFFFFNCKTKSIN